jgi:DeoR/GlpR family transcriptional regulator of sugar metabolism
MSESGKSDPMDAVIAFLRTQIVPVDVPTVVSATGLTENTVRRTLGKLAKDRVARRAGGGKFTLAKYERQKGDLKPEA